MAFVGFKSDGDAEGALTYFNNSFVDTFRITVEVWGSVGEGGAGSQP